MAQGVAPVDAAPDAQPRGGARDAQPAGGAQGARARASGWLRRTERTYAGDEDRPLGSFLALMGGYGAMVAGLSAAVRATGRPLPESLPARDLALVTVATFRVSRLLAKDPVTSPLRAPFTRFQGASGEAELAEEVRDGGSRKAVGELVTCPFCLGQWVATGFAFGLVLAPRPTRLAASVMTALAGADLLQFGYARAQQAAQ